MSLVVKAEVENKIVMDSTAQRIANNQNNNMSGSLGDNGLNNPGEDISDNVSDTKHLLKDINISLKQFFLNFFDKVHNRADSASGNISSHTNLPQFQNNGIVRGFQNGSNFISVMSQDHTGTMTLLNGMGQVGNLLGGASKFLSGKGLGALGMAAGGIASGLAAGGATIKGLDEMAKNSEKALPNMEKLQALYFDNNRFEGRTDVIHGRPLGETFYANKELALRKDIASNNINTGLTNENFIGLVSDLSSIGFTSDKDRSGNITKNATIKAAEIAAKTAQTAYGIGMDVNDMAQYTKYIERYGEGNSGDVIERTFQNARATGLTRGQTSEYFEGITRALEEGLSKGFTKSASEVSKNIANVSLRSGNDKYWQGEEGINRYLVASNGMAGNTALASSSNMLLYRAMQQANPEMGWTEIMQKIEAGDWGDETFIEKYKETLMNAYGGDKDSIMASIKESFGTNWKGAAEMYKTIIDGESVDVDEVSNRYTSKAALNGSDYLNQKNAESRIEAYKAESGTAPYKAKLDTIVRLMESGERRLNRLMGMFDNITVTY